MTARTSQEATELPGQAARRIIDGDSLCTVLDTGLLPGSKVLPEKCFSGVIKLTAALLLLTPVAAKAQTFGSAIPGAGAILQQIPPLAPSTPASSATGLKIEQEGGAKYPLSAPFEVKALSISGNTLFAPQALHALVADGMGRSLTLPQLDELAGRITNYYRSQGYPLTRAIIPAQVIRDGVVAIEIIEARYGRVILENRSQVNDALLQETLAGLPGGAPIAQAALDRALLLLSDIPGLASSATLKPGPNAGTSNLLVTAEPAPVLTGNALLDGYGSRQTGRARIGATASLVGPLHHGDVLSVNGMSSGGGMNYLRLAYDTLLNGRGSHLGGSYSELHYILGGSLAPLIGHGSAGVRSLWAKHPLLRAPDASLYGELQYDAMQLRDHLDATSIRNDRSLSDWTASLYGNSRDALLSGAVNNWNISWSAGRLEFDDGAAQLADGATARTQGRFAKWTANVSRLQNLDQRSALYLSIYAQRTNDNLDASKKMTAGGPYTVRAYETGAISGDSGYLVTAEFRRELGRAWQGQWQAVAFIDNARLTVNKIPWVAGPNSAALNGAGAGLNWAGMKQWSARVYAAKPIGAKPVQLANTGSARLWLELSTGF